MLVIIDGLEMFALHKGINLRCDGCGAKFVANPDVGAGSGKAGEAELQRQARVAGWTGPLTRESDDDRCPNCTLAISS